MTSVLWEVAEIGRLLHAHRLDPTLACSALGIKPAEAQRLANTGEISTLQADRQQHAALLLNILVRLEVRCRHDSRAITAAMGRPAAELAGKSIGEALHQPIDVERLREIAGTLPLPKVRMWRVPDSYS